MAEAALAGEPRDRPATIWAPSADFNRVLDGIRGSPKLTSIFLRRCILNRRNVLCYPAKNLEQEEQTSCARHIGVWSQLDGFSLRSGKSLR